MNKVKPIDFSVENFYKKNQNLQDCELAKAFQAMGLSRATSYRKVRRLRVGAPLRKQGSGRPAKIATANNIKIIEQNFKNRDGCSQRKVAKQIKSTQPYVSYILKKYTNIRCYKKIKKPKRTAAQLRVIRPKCRKMYKMYKNRDYVIDGESYFTLDNSDLAGNDMFYSDDINSCSDNIKYKLVEKFAPKLLVWIAMCPRGASEIYIVPKNLSINQDIYMQECLSKRLLPMLRKHYKNNNNYIF